MVQANLDPSFALAKDLADLRRRIAVLESQDMLPNSSLSTGDVSVTGGSVLVTGGGSVNVTGSGSMFVNGVNLAQLSAASQSALSTSSFTPSTSFGAWNSNTSLPKLTASTPTGKLLVTISTYLSLPYQASGPSAVGGATFSIAAGATTYVNRDTQLYGFINGFTGATNGVVGLLASSQPSVAFTSSFSQVVTGLPLNTNLTVQSEIWGGYSATFSSISLIVQVVQ